MIAAACSVVGWIFLILLAMSFYVEKEQAEEELKSTKEQNEKLIDIIKKLMEDEEDG